MSSKRIVRKLRVLEFRSLSEDTGKHYTTMPATKHPYSYRYTYLIGNVRWARQRPRRPQLVSHTYLTVRLCFQKKRALNK